MLGLQTAAYIQDGVGVFVVVGVFFGRGWGC